MSTPTPHNKAKLGEIAKTVLMPGDPLRAKFLAETYLDDVVMYNDVRGMYGYTGTYKGKRVSVQGHGMGIPSIGTHKCKIKSLPFIASKGQIKYSLQATKQIHLLILCGEL